MKFSSFVAYLCVAGIFCLASGTYLAAAIYEIPYIEKHTIVKVKQCNVKECLVDTDLVYNVYVRRVVAEGLTVYRNCNMDPHSQEVDCRDYLNSFAKSGLTEADLSEIVNNWKEKNFLERFAYTLKLGQRSKDNNPGTIKGTKYESY